MSKDVNKCIFIGRLGQDPKVNFLPNGSGVTNFSIAVGDDYKDKNTGQKVEQTEWVNVSAFAKLGEVCAQYLKKGSKVYIEGKFKTRKWPHQDGSDRYSTSIQLNEMQMLDGKPDNGGQNASHAPQQQSQAPQHGGGDFDQDLPF